MRRHNTAVYLSGRDSRHESPPPLKAAGANMTGRFDAAFQSPLQLHLAPSRWRVPGEEDVDYAIYVEPPKAPGLQQVIPPLRRKLKG